MVLRQCTLSAAIRAFRWSQALRPVAALGQRSNNLSDALCSLFNGNVTRCIYDEGIRAKRRSKLFLGKGEAQYIGDVPEDLVR